MRYSVAMRVDEVAIVISHLKGSHDDDMIAVLYSFIVLVHFKEVRTEGDSVVVLVKLRVFRVVVDARNLTMAVVVWEDEDDSLATNAIHTPKVEVSVVVDGDLEAVAAKLYNVLALRHNGIVAEVREDGQDLRGLESGGHVVE
jgi:hypothetical protein